jgi:uncharacterized membrane protein
MSDSENSKKDPNRQNDLKESPMAVYGLIHIGILIVVLLLIALIVGSG